MPHPDLIHHSVALQQFCQSYPLDIWVNESLGGGIQNILTSRLQAAIFTSYIINTKEIMEQRA